MREISLIEVTKNIREMCIEANYFLEEDVKKALNRACKTESSPIGISVLEQLEENLEISEKEMNRRLGVTENDLAGFDEVEIE